MILLDTHVLLWWITDRGRLSDGQRDLLDDDLQTRIVSAVTCWEIALAHARGRITLNKPAEQWLGEAATGWGVEFVPLTDDIAVASVTLPDGLHRDPADRFLVATARTLGCPLLTTDGKILAYPHVDTVG